MRRRTSPPCAATCATSWRNSHRAAFGQEAGREGEIARVHGKGRRDDAEDELVGGLLERAPAAVGQPAERQPAATPGLAQGERRRPALLLGEVDEAEVEASERAGETAERDVRLYDAARREHESRLGVIQDPTGHIL
jgi:hypothetical protein